MADEPILIVVDGPQRGATMRLPRGESHVGSDVGSAVVIADPMMGANHLRIAVDNGVQLLADSAITLDDGMALAPGDLFDVTRACGFTAGNTRFRLELAQKAVTSDEIQRGVETTGTRWRTVCFILLGAGGVFGATVIGGMAIGSSGTPEEPIGADTSAVHLELPAPPTIAATTTFLQQHLDESGLSDVVVTTQADGTLVVSGSLTADQRRDWNTIRHLYDQRFGTARVLVEQFESAGSLPSLHLAAVWLGQNPYVIDERGSRLQPGASLGDGWSIDRISSQSVIVKQGTRVVALKY